MNDLNTIKVIFCDVIRCSIGVYKRPLHESRYENWPIWNWKKSYHLLVKFILMFTCSEMIWNSYRGRCHKAYFDRFEIQYPIWVALHIFVVQVRAWKHENWRWHIAAISFYNQHLSDVLGNMFSKVLQYSQEITYVGVSF